MSKITTRGAPYGYVVNTETGIRLPVLPTNYAWFVLQDEMDEDWAGCQRGDRMIERITMYIPKDWPLLRQFMLVVAKRLEHEVSLLDSMGGVERDVLDTCSGYASDAIKWVRDEMPESIGFVSGQIPEDSAWKEIGSKVSQGLRRDDYAVAIEAVLLDDGWGRLCMLGFGARYLARRCIPNDQRLNMLEHFADIVRAAFPESPDMEK